jgi:antitoxin component YwqK of YwqJK toxin-antitoxin module
VSLWTRLFGDRDRMPDGERAGAMRGGKKHGVWIEKEPYKLVEYTYRDGAKHGPSREWHQDGFLLTKLEYADDAKDGFERRFRPNGTLAYEAMYRGGKMNGPCRGFGDDGTVEYEREYRDDKIYEGPYELLGTDGKLIWRGRYVAGHRVGLWEEHHYDGHVNERGHYDDDGNRHGEFEFGDDNKFGAKNNDTWRGSFERGKRTGTWRLFRKDVELASGEWPDGTPTTWTVRAGDRDASIDVVDEDQLRRWIAFLEQWLTNAYSLRIDEWPDDERRRAAAWIDARVTAKPRAFPHDVPRVRPEEVRDRSVLAAATAGGTIAAQPRVEPTGPSPQELRAERKQAIDELRDDDDDIDDDDDDGDDREDDDDGYMSRWSRGGAELRVVAIATLDLSERIIVDSPGRGSSGYSVDPRSTIAAVAGTYDVIGFDCGDGLDLTAVVVRRTGVPVATWRYWDDASDSDICVVDSGGDFTNVTFDEDNEAPPPRAWVSPGRTADGKHALWITNPSGNGLRCYAGLAADDTLACLVFQAY